MSVSLRGVIWPRIEREIDKIPGVGPEKKERVLAAIRAELSIGDGQIAKCAKCGRWTCAQCGEGDGERWWCVLCSERGALFEASQRVKKLERDLRRYEDECGLYRQYAEKLEKKLSTENT